MQGAQTIIQETKTSQIKREKAPEKQDRSNEIGGTFKDFIKEALKEGTALSHKENPENVEKETKQTESPNVSGDAMMESQWIQGQLAMQGLVAPVNGAAEPTKTLQQTAEVQGGAELMEGKVPVSTDVSNLQKMLSAEIKGPLTLVDTVKAAQQSEVQNFKTQLQQGTIQNQETVVKQGIIQTEGTQIATETQNMNLQPEKTLQGNKPTAMQNAVDAKPQELAVAQNEKETALKMETIKIEKASSTQSPNRQDNAKEVLTKNSQGSNSDNAKSRELNIVIATGNKSDAEEVKADKPKPVVADTKSTSAGNVVKDGNITEKEKVTLEKITFKGEDAKTGEAPQIQKAQLDPTKVNIKVGEPINTANKQFANQVADKIIFAGENGHQEIEIQLSPKDLGKITIKLIFEGNSAHIQMTASNAKAQSLLNLNAESIKQIVETNTNTNVVVNSNDENKMNHQREGYDGRGERQEKEAEPEKRKEQQDEDAQKNFLNQLRLGLLEKNAS